MYILKITLFREVFINRVGLKFEIALLILAQNLIVGGAGERRLSKQPIKKFWIFRY